MVGYHDPKVAVLDEGTITSISRVYADIQEKIKKLETEKQTIKDMLFNHFDLTQGKNSAAEIECGDGFKFAREIRTSKRIDEIKLEETLKPAVWKSITSTKRLVDETKLRRAISSNIINKNVIKNCVVEKKTFAFTHPSIKQEEK
jgi:hypothetical protein